MHTEYKDRERGDTHEVTAVERCEEWGRGIDQTGNRAGISGRS